MLPNIDFLPASYRQTQLGRRRKTWRAGVLAAFASLAVLGTFAQYQVRSRLEQSRIEMQSQAEHMASQLENADELSRRVRDLDARANLLTRLRVHPASTRLLSDVTRTLPRFVSLSEFHVSVETKSTTAEEKARNKADKNSLTNLTPQATDLAQLEDVASRSTQVILLRGVAPDDVAVAKYLAALEETGSFEHVQLLFTDGHQHRGYELRHFGIRLHVRSPKLGARPPELTERNDGRST